jgi:hypothetical protein
VAERDRAAVGVDLLGVELGPVGQAGQRLRRERLVELDDLDLVPADARAAQRFVGRLDGSRPASCAARSSPTNSAPAPSLSGEELPAVTEPATLKAGSSLASASIDESGRMPWSRSSSAPGTATTWPE